MADKTFAVGKEVAQYFNGLTGAYLPRTGFGHPGTDDCSLTCACDDHDNGALTGLHARIEILASHYTIDWRAQGCAFEGFVRGFEIVFCLVQRCLGLAHCRFGLLNFSGQGTASHQVEIFEFDF